MLASNSFIIKAVALVALAVNASCAAVPSNNDLWKVLSRTTHDNKKLKWPHLPTKNVKVDAATDDGRKFSHYPFIYNVGGTLYLLFSASKSDVDGMGQNVRIATSLDSGATWTKPEIAFPRALLPNQTSVQNSKYWCDRGIPQRALQPLTITSLPGGDEGSYKVYAVAQSSDNICPGEFQSAGRIARELDVHGSGLFKGDPCWIETNDYTTSHEWAKTIYGTKFGMKVCDQKDAITEAINRPDNLGPVATKLFNAPIIAADGKHNVSYPTKAVWHGPSDKGYWQRFWSDVSVANSTGSQWVEYSTDKDGKNWYPATDSGSGIHETNIYGNKKAHFGAFDGSKQLRYLVSNAGLNVELDQELLTVATSRGDDPAFHKIGVVRGGDADKGVSKGTREVFNSGVPGFYWPSAAEVGDKLAVAYSENREVIWVSVIEKSDLP